MRGLILLGLILSGVVNEELISGMRIFLLLIGCLVWRRLWPAFQFLECCSKILRLRRFGLIRLLVDGLIILSMLLCNGFLIILGSLFGGGLLGRREFGTVGVGMMLVDGLLIISVGGGLLL